MNKSISLFAGDDCHHFGASEVASASIYISEIAESNYKAQSAFRGGI